MKTSISGSMSDDWPAEEDVDLAEAAAEAGAELDTPTAPEAATAGDPPDCCSDVDWLVAACRKMIS